MTGERPEERTHGSPGEVSGMAVALVLAASTGGIGEHVRSLAAGLAARGAQVTVAAPETTGELFRFHAAGAAFVPVDISGSPRPWRDARTVVRLRRAVSRADVVHAHGLRAGLVAGLAVGPFRVARVPYVVSWHNAVLTRGLRGRASGVLELSVARMAGVTLAASPDLADRARALGARDVRFAPVASPPVRPSPRAPQEVRGALGAADRPLVLAVGRLAPQKGYPVLLEAARDWRRRDPPPLIAIAGEGPLREEIGRRSASEGLGIRLLGHRTDIADLLAAADVVVLPSRWEARSLVAQAALRLGRPLVATAVGGMPELVGDAGLLVPADDAAAFARAVTRLLDDPGLAARMARAARSRGMTLPTEDDVLRQVMAVYRELAV